MTTKLMEDLREAHGSIKEHYAGKRTLKTHRVPVAKPIRMTARRVKTLRKRLNVSQEVFARYLHTSRRTVEKWEQGTSKPTGSAAVLLALVEKRPKLLDELLVVS
ncbi:MAG: helix-turn-helix domain-containing protein [Planctomycetota bacterium]|jgi:putative transcriptional regulator|nr:helix-turn-helix domain-containing protein [Planctomycetota bacterium]